ncbi:MAG TPA: FtsX-like permease family protein [Streptosporangiaceae bacterium]
MGRLAWSQLRFGAVRTVALLAGMLIAATAFTVLTAASRTSQLRTTGTVSAHFRAAYDILVRPPAARSPLEAQTGTVQPNFLSGLYGGITMADYRQIQHLPGVQVAAPVAMVGYSLPVQSITEPLPASALAGSGRELFRYDTTWVSAGGATRISQPASYVYVTPRPLSADNATGASYETQGGARAEVCPAPAPATSPFSPAVQAQAWCWSKVNGLSGGGSYQNLTASRPGVVVTWEFPMLIAAVDPAAEARLDDLPHALTSGRYLAENAGPGEISPGGHRLTTFPVLAAARSGIGEWSQTQVRRLADPSGPPALDAATMSRDATAPGQPVLSVRIDAQQAYEQLLAALSGTPGTYPGINQYWSVGAIKYTRAPDGDLVPAPVRNPLSVWRSAFGTDGFVSAPVDNADTAYRRLTSHAPSSSTIAGATLPIPVPRLAGEFSPARIASFDPLSRVPLGIYQPATAGPASAASRRALNAASLLPTLNLAGYVSQPVQLVTTLSALPALENHAYFSGDLHAADPISVIRVRVAGVAGPDAVSLARIRQVAQQIAVRTHLTVDIVAGSSPRLTVVDLPAGRFGQPGLRLTEGWVHKGVAVAILTAVDRKSVVLFTLILLVCVLFVANSATAAVRGRRRSLGVLACLGWTRPRLFATVLGELAGIGLVAGLLGGALALPIAAGLGLHPSVARAALALPVAMAVAIVAGAGPAWIATRADPLATIRPPVIAARRAYHPGGITGLAVLNVTRNPGRTLIGVVSLAVGVAALTLLTAITIAFRGVVVGSLLGDAVAVQIRGVDYVAVITTVLLGLLAVADVVFLNIRERAAELATIRSFGWPEHTLDRMIVTEGALIGAAGALAGAVAGLAAAATFAGQLTFRLAAAAVVAAAAGTLLTAAAAIPPARMLRRLPAAQLLAED